MNEALVVTIILKIRQYICYFSLFGTWHCGPYSLFAHCASVFFVTFVTIFTGRQGQKFSLCFPMQKKEESDSGEGLHSYNESSKMVSFCQMIWSPIMPGC